MMKKAIAFLISILAVTVMISFPVFTAVPIDINVASAAELRNLSGVGADLADRIIEARPYYDLADLLRVEGIGEIELEQIRSQGLALVESNFEDRVHIQDQLERYFADRYEMLNNFTINPSFKAYFYHERSLELFALEELIRRRRDQEAPHLEYRLDFREITVYDANEYEQAAVVQLTEFVSTQGESVSIEHTIHLIGRGGNWYIETGTHSHLDTLDELTRSVLSQV